jgi:hypothetical protein
LAPRFSTCIKQDGKVPVWNGLTEGDLDVDSIYRLTNNQPISLLSCGRKYLPKQAYCPFNSQDTFWFEDAFALMFLPTTVEFRFTDILRGYIAQPILWAVNSHLGFLGPNTIQERNEHNLMTDFRDEIRMFDKTKEIVDCIENAIEDRTHVQSNMMLVYHALYEKGFVQKQDVELLYKWLETI